MQFFWSVTTCISLIIRWKSSGVQKLTRMYRGDNIRDVPESASGNGTVSTKKNFPLSSNCIFAKFWTQLDFHWLWQGLDIYVIIPDIYRELATGKPPVGLLHTQNDIKKYLSVYILYIYSGRTKGNFDEKWHTCNLVSCFYRWCCNILALSK